MTIQKEQMHREVEALAHELSKLAIACDIELGKEGLPQKILRKDESVCGRRNPEAFAKLRRHLMVLLKIEDEAIDELGAQEAIGTLNEVFAEVARLRKLGSPNASVPRQF